MGQHVVESAVNERGLHLGNNKWHEITLLCVPKRKVVGPAAESTADLRSVAGWKHAFGRTMNDWSMVASDVVIGFFLAGIVATFVPNSIWEQLFTLAPEGTFAWVMLGCFFGTKFAVLTFLCSIGNVPFAVIQWNAGTPVGGVISFIFGDLVVPQIDNLYRKYYGLRMAGALFVSIFTVAVVTGVIIYYLWATLGVIPEQQGRVRVGSEYVQSDVHCRVHRALSRAGLRCLPRTTTE